MPMYDYLGTGQSLGGVYSVAQRSGELAATIGAAGHLARIRWTDTAFVCVVKKIQVGISVSAAITTGVEFTLRAIVVRGFSVDFTTAITNISMAAVAGTNSHRSQFMRPSRMGTAGPGIATTTVMSGQTLTADAAPFAVAPIPTLIPVTATGTAVAIPVGTASNLITLYEQNTQGGHGIVLSQNEGVVIQPHVAGPASGTFGLYVKWEWAELPVY